MHKCVGRSKRDIFERVFENAHIYDNSDKNPSVNYHTLQWGYKSPFTGLNGQHLAPTVRICEPQLCSYAIFYLSFDSHNFQILLRITDGITSLAIRNSLLSKELKFQALSIQPSRW